MRLFTPGDHLPSAILRTTRSLAIVAAIATVLATLALGFAAAPPAGAAQPAPGHTGLVPSTPRTNTPRISTGEIWDIEVVGQRVFIAGTFSSLQNTTGNTAVVNQRYLASYNWSTGLIDTAFRPTFGGGGVSAVEASPDGLEGEEGTFSICTFWYVDAFDLGRSAGRSEPHVREDAHLREPPRSLRWGDRLDR